MKIGFQPAVMLHAVGQRVDDKADVVSLFSTTIFPITLVSNSIEGLRVDTSGNVEIGTAALPTTATDGFLYIPTCAGPPTGTPTAKAGRVPMIIDTVNNELYIYNGSWLSSGAFT